jgi:hypothetical protein
VRLAFSTLAEAQQGYTLERDHGHDVGDGTVGGNVQGLDERDPANLETLGPLGSAAPGVMSVAKQPVKLGEPPQNGSRKHVTVGSCQKWLLTLSRD